MLKKCEICGREFEAKRSTARYCSATCRKRKQRGYPFVGELGVPGITATMSTEEVAEILQRGHLVASDLSRASMMTSAPLCLSLKRASKKIEDALSEEGL